MTTGRYRELHFGRTKKTTIFRCKNLSRNPYPKNGVNGEIVVLKCVLCLGAYPRPFPVPNDIRCCAKRFRNSLWRFLTSISSIMGARSCTILQLSFYWCLRVIYQTSKIEPSVKILGKIKNFSQKSKFTNRNFGENWKFCWASKPYSKVKTLVKHSD